MRKDLLRRLEKLEAHRALLRVDGIFWANDLVNPRKLGPNERIVEDWYLGSDNQILSYSGRIATDPGDEGWNYRGPHRQKADPRFRFTTDTTDPDSNDEGPDRQVIDLNIRREIKVVDESEFYRARSLSRGDNPILGAPTDAESDELAREVSKTPMGWSRKLWYASSGRSQ